MSAHRFAAVVPAHDALPFVLEAVQSALAQTHPPEEVVVVDDSSRDGTGAEVERRFGTSVRVVRGRFGSAAAARNAGWRTARAPWVAFLDADDLWFPDKLAAAGAVLGAAPEAGWFFSDGAFRTLEGEVRSSWLRTYADLDEGYVGHPVAELFEVNFVLTSSVVVKRQALEALGGFDESLSHAEDLDLWIRLARRWPAAGSRAALVRYQHRPGGLTRQVEARLQGDVALFRRLARDRTLDRGLRSRAGRREALAHYKLALAALREGRAGDARRHLRPAWRFPERAWPVAATWVVSLLPAGVRERMRRQEWVTRGVATPMARQRRVALRARPRVPAPLAGETA